MRRFLASLLLLLALLALAALLPGRLTRSVAAAPAPQAAGDEDTFTPSEKLPADSAISFPVDI